MNIPAEEWTKKIQEHVKKSQELMNHYEMLCEEKKVSFALFSFYINFDQLIMYSQINAPLELVVTVFLETF